MNDSSKPHAGLWDRNLPHDQRHALFGGRGVVRVWALVSTPALPFTAVLACELEPGGSVGPHVQEHFPELVLAIAGSGTLSVDGVASPFGPGRVVELARGRSLAIANDSSSSPLHYLIIKAQG